MLYPSRVSRTSAFVILITFCVFRSGTSQRACGGNIRESSGVITSPSYPSPYPSFLDCVWVITAPNGSRITLNVVDFYVEYDSDCEYDYLEIRKGSFKSSPLVGKYCGQRQISSIQQDDGDIRLEFRTDGSVPAKGFKIEFSISPTGNVPKEEYEILYSDRVSIKKMDLRSLTGNATTIVSDLSNAVAIDYHLEKKLVVWTDVREKGIYSTSVDGRGDKKTLLRVDIITPDGLAVDWVHGNIYWTDTGSNSISVATLDGEMRKLLFGAYIDEPRAIVVNPSEGWMFWTDWGASPKIERAGMDGSRRSTIVSKDIAVPNGLAIDYGKRKLYWADVRFHSISCSNYDGSNVRTIFVSTRQLGHPFAVDVFQDSLYWTDWRTHSISKLKLDTNETSDIDIKSLFPMGIRIYHPAKQPKVTSYCGENNNKCSNGLLCLPTPRGTDAALNYVCACPDGKDCSRIDIVTERTTSTRSTFYSTAEERTHTKEFTRAHTTKSYTTSRDIEAPIQSELQSSASNEILHEIRENVYFYGRIAGITFGMMVILIIVLSLVGFFTYKESLRKKIGGLSFVNPVYKKQTEDQEKLDTRLAGEAGLSPFV